MLSKYDQGNGLMSYSDFVQFIMEKGIFMRKDERDSLLTKLNPVNCNVRIQDLTDLILIGRGDKSGERAILGEAYYLRFLINQIKEGLKMNKRGGKIFDAIPSDSPSVSDTRFKQGLAEMKIENSAELDALCRLCADKKDKTMVNLDIVQFILDNIETYHHIISNEDARYLDKFYNDLRKFLEEDGYDTQFKINRLIESYKPERGFISRKNFEMLLSKP